MFDSIYDNLSTLVVGHTGFKGSWLTLWLQRLGANVTGYALKPPTLPSHHDLLALNTPSTIGDVRKFDEMLAHFTEHRPEIVFHLAAQPSVLQSYVDPIETFSTNVLGTALVLEACRQTPSVRAVVIVTTDKCYENKEWLWGYREEDALGGHDPYSVSKACAELVTTCYRRCFSDQGTTGRSRPLLIASARSGNVVGGGDWTADRLIPDVMRAAAAKVGVQLRNPDSSRPWQHVLEPLSGYLLLGQRLFQGQTDFAQPWNFGPNLESNLTVRQLFEQMKRIWPAVQGEFQPREGSPYEAKLLMLDSTKARRLLGWKPVWNIQTTLERTVHWYRAWCERSEILTAEQIEQYSEEARDQGVSWTK